MRPQFFPVTFSLSLFFSAQKYTVVGELGKATDTFISTGKVTEEKPYGK